MSSALNQLRDDEWLLVELFRSSEFEEEGRQGDHDHLRPCQTAVRVLRQLRADLAQAREELALWKPLTPAEAEAAFASAKAAPMTEEQIQRIVKRVTDPAERLTNPEEAQLHVRIADLTARCEAAEAAAAAMRAALQKCRSDVCPETPPEVDEMIAAALSQPAAARYAEWVKKMEVVLQVDPTGHCPIGCEWCHEWNERRIAALAAKPGRE